MKVGFYSTMVGMPWGGSEVLWASTAMRLIHQGEQVTANVKWWPQEARQLVELRSAGASIWRRGNPAPLYWLEQAPIQLPGSERRFARRWLDREQPDFVLITVGNHLDPLFAADPLLRRKIPYAVNVQSAGPHFIHECQLDQFRQAYQQAQVVYFVSRENWDRLESNLAIRLDNARVIDNPFNVSFDASPAWPEDTSVYHLACVARLHFHSKGQDLLVNVLRQSKWRERSLCINLVGHPQGNYQQMYDLIELNGLQSHLKFAGYWDSTEAIWSKHHGLILPSRYEGAALSIVEALLCNRICIATDVGRNRELIDHAETGFIAGAATEELLDEVLEVAWQQRSKWKAMGELAGVRIRERYSRDPVGTFLADLLAAIQKST